MTTATATTATITAGHGAGLYFPLPISGDNPTAHGSESETPIPDEVRYLTAI